MSTITEGSSGSDVYFSGDAKLDSLLGWAKWGGPLGTGAVITFSFPTSKSNFAIDGQTEFGGYDPNQELSSFSPFSEAQKAGARAALAAWTEVANVHFVEVADGPSEVGDIRFSNSAYVGKDGNAAAWAYMPDTWPQPVNGDVWVDPKYAPNFQMAPGQFGSLMLIHEIGHALCDV